MTTGKTVHPVDEVLPAQRLGTLGLQHVLVMYAGAITVPLIIGGALHLPKEQLALLVNADLLICGIATLIQSLGAWNVGIRLPIMMGVSFVSVGPMLAMAANPALGAPAMFGSIISAGLFGILVAPFASRLLAYFPPVVTGTVILVIGLTLMKVGVNWAAGGQPVIFGPNGPTPNPQYGLVSNLAIAALVLVCVIAIVRLATGFLSNVAVLIGILVGFAVSFALGNVDLTGLPHASWVGVVTPFWFGLPVFDPWAIAIMCLVMIVIMIESMGMFLAVGEIVGKPVTQGDLTRALRADGVGTLLGGFFNAFPYTSYSQNVGLVQVTGVRSRWVCVVGGVMLVILGLIPKLAFIVASIPQPVLGGAAIVMFGMVAATGVRILSRVDYASNRDNLYIVAVSTGIGMIPLVADKFFQHVPPALAPITQSGIMMSALCAVLLNVILNGAGEREPSAVVPVKLAKVES